MLAALREEAARRLYEFIHPVSGWVTHEGWPFGKTLTPGDVYPLLQSVPNVVYVSDVRFTEMDSNGSPLGEGAMLIRVGDTEVLCSAADHDVVVDLE